MSRRARSGVAVGACGTPLLEQVAVAPFSPFQCRAGYERPFVSVKQGFLSHFIDGEIEALSGLLIFPKLKRQEMAED